MTESEECTLESVIRGHHIYKRIWQPLVGEVLTLEQEGNTHDRFAISLLKDTIVVGHVPVEDSDVIQCTGTTLKQLLSLLDVLEQNWVF